MKKKITIFAASFAVLAGAVAFTAIQKQNRELSFLWTQNVEALAEVETMGLVTGSCSGSPIVVYCQAECNSCGLIWRADGGYGVTSNVSGTCLCGSTSFDY